MPTTHLLTGATGLLGAALVLQLAAETDDLMVCLVRPGSGDPTHRLHHTLRQAAAAYGTCAKTTQKALRHSRALPFDLTDPHPPGPGLPAGRNEVEVWHSAALMLFRPAERRRSFAANRAGTERMVRLAQQLPTRTFNYISTAYVAGLNEGTITEGPVLQARPRNPYEASKLSAERRLARALDLPVRVMRPSIIVGHSQTLRYPGTPSGLFTVQRLIAAHLLSASPGRSPRISALPEEPFDLIPIDHVAEQAARLHLRDAPTGHYHLTNPAAAPTGEALEAMVANAGRPAPTFRADADHRHPEDRRLHRMLAVYSPYLTNRQRFDRARTDAALGLHDAGWRPEKDALRRMLSPFTEDSSTRHGRKGISGG
ncbi:SDR family oxidoreductase [Streptomyces sp. NPDC058877]|uniref:SDR family oxidoreductase n=1 Tax=unclassified Streptomyces TaxID=2593676 RepID=UPI0036BA4C11